MVTFLPALILELKLPLALFPLFVAPPTPESVAMRLLLVLQLRVTGVLFIEEAVDPLATMGKLKVVPCRILTFVRLEVRGRVDSILEGLASTRTAKVAVAFELRVLLTLIVAVPGFLPVTTPLAFTVATRVFVLVQVTLLFGVAPAAKVKFGFPKDRVRPRLIILQLGRFNVILVGALDIQRA